MIDGLKLFNLPSGHSTMLPQNGEVFILKTCQRTIVLGHQFVPFFFQNTNSFKDIETYTGTEAYHFLLETICGLKSRVLAENEIVGQFKQAYSEYLTLPHKSTHLMNVLEKLFKDGKLVRSKHLHNVGQQSYAGISRRLMDRSSFKNPSKKVLIIGSGNLSWDLIKLLKKNYQLHLTARNSEKMTELCVKFGLTPVPWKDYDQWSKFGHIINTIGVTELTLFNEEFFNTWTKAHALKFRLFVDLGSPSVVKTQLDSNEQVYNLDDVFQLGAMLDSEKQIKVNLAQKRIEELVEKRYLNFTINLAHGWDELQFA